jgi:hypothetical protein
VGKNKVLLKLLAVAITVWGVGQWLLLLLGLLGMPGIAFLIVMMVNSS